MSKQLPIVGVIGLGAMGTPMAQNLMAAGYPVYGFDVDPKRCHAAGIQSSASIAELVAETAIMMTSLPSSQAFIDVAEQDQLSTMRPGQTLIDFGTTAIPQTRRLATAFAARGVAFIDAPVSGGPSGVEQRQLFLFLGGEHAVIESLMPLFRAIGGADRITYCGPVGSGQAVKGVNQLMMGLGNAAYLEAIAFGVNAGVDIDIIKDALGNSGRWRADLHNTAQQISAGHGEQVGVKFRELPYFLEAAAALAFPLPLTEQLYNSCDGGERVVIDDNRPAPSFWRELTK